MFEKRELIHASVEMSIKTHFESVQHILQQVIQILVYSKRDAYCDIFAK